MLDQTSKDSHSVLLAWQNSMFQHKPKHSQAVPIINDLDGTELRGCQKAADVLLSRQAQLCKLVIS